MPFIPRYTAPTTGAAARPPAPIPVRPPGGRADEEKPRKTLRIRPAKVSPHTYEPDVKTTLRSLLGKDLDVDPHTGRLVLPKPGFGPAG